MRCQVGGLAELLPELRAPREKKHEKGEKDRRTGHGASRRTALRTRCLPHASRAKHRSRRDPRLTAATAVEAVPAHTPAAPKQPVPPPASGPPPCSPSPSLSPPPPQPPRGPPSDMASSLGGGCAAPEAMESGQNLWTGLF